jgi:hypothetical protein
LASCVAYFFDNASVVQPHRILTCGTLKTILQIVSESLARLTILLRFL